MLLTFYAKFAILYTESFNLKKMKKLLLFFSLTFLRVASCVEDESQIFSSALASAFEEHNPIKLDAFEDEV